MKTEQWQWSAQTGWDGRLPSGTAALGASAQIVLLFGNMDDVVGGQCFDVVHTAYPNACLFGCTTAGEIQGTYGHPVGDLVLQEITRRLCSCIYPADEIGRYGGEEFLIVLADCDGNTALYRAEQLRKIIESQPILLAQGELHVTCSFGVNWTQEGIYDSSLLIREADAALYRAKQAGRNRVEMTHIQGSLVS